MLAVVDTDHFTAIQRDAAFARRVEARRVEARRVSRGFEMFIGVASVQETVKGWLALLNRVRNPGQEVDGYARLQRGMEALRDWDMLPFDGDAASRFAALKRQFKQAGTMDLKIAAICLAHDAVFLTRNLRHFDFIPGLRAENWLE